MNGPGTHFTMGLSAHYWKSCENSFALVSILIIQLGHNFVHEQLSCHDMCKIVTWYDQCYWRKNNINFDKIWIVSSPILCEMSPCSILTNSPQFVTGSLVWGASINLATSAWPRPVVAKIHVQMSQGWPCHDLAGLYELNKKKSISHQCKWDSIELLPRTAHDTGYSINALFKENDDNNKPMLDNCKLDPCQKT